MLSARMDLLARLGKSIIPSLLAPSHPSLTQCYKMRSQTIAFLLVTAPCSPGALEAEFRGLRDCSSATEHNTRCVAGSAFPLQTSFKLRVTQSHFSNSTRHFLCLGLVSWCEAFTKPVPQPVNIKWPCQHLFIFFFLPFLILRVRFSAGAYSSQHCVPSQLLLLSRQTAVCAESIMFSWYC